MRHRKRVERMRAAVAGTSGCPGPGVVNRLAADGDPDPPPCPACGGCHAVVIEGVIVTAGDFAVDRGGTTAAGRNPARPCHVPDRT